MKNFTLIGSGLVGSLLSIYLAKRGYNVTVYERRPDLRKNRISAGRSINLALSDRGWAGLAGVGIVDEIKKVAIPMTGRMMHSKEGKLTYQAYGKEGQAINSVSRGGLNCVLMDLAEKHGVKIHFNKRCTHIDLKTAVAHFEDNDSKEIIEVAADRVFSTDGAFSAGRLQMQLSTDLFTYSQTYLEHGYKELTIPPTAEGEFAMEPNALHIWPRDSYMLIALPNLDKSFTCTLFFPFEGETSFKTINSEQKALEFFKTNFADFVPLIPNLEKEFFTNPTSSLMTVRCYPWRYQDKFLMVGDSAHGVVPFYGQGMNCGFEDCVVLDKMMDQYGDDWDTIFEEFQKSRKPDSDAIAQLALDNFVEMRDRVGKPSFLLQKKIENWFSEKHPDKWIPLYTMVTYSPHIRYSEAYREGQKQESIMQQVMNIPDIENKWNSPEVEEKIITLLEYFK
jgi:kynurenine 3-monooxygenase